MEKITKMFVTENELMYNIVAYPLAFLEFFVLLVLIKNIYNISTSKKQDFIFILFTGIIACSIRLFLPMPFNFVFNFILNTFLICFILSLSLFQSIVFHCIFLIATVISELIVLFILKCLTFSYLLSAQQIPIYKIVCCLCIYFLIYICIKIISKTKVNLNISDNISYKTKLLITSGILITIVILYPNAIFLIMENMQLPSSYIIYNIITGIGLFIYTTFGADKINKGEISKRELETSKLYNDTMQSVVDNNRDFRHNITNVINSIGGYIELNDMKGLKEYYNSGILLDIRRLQNLSLFNPQTINNPAVFGLLLAKLDYARNMNVDFTLRSFLNYSTINMNTFEFVKVLGILLDNAIEASSKSTEKLVELYVNVDFCNRQQIFQISNTYIDKNVDLEKIFEKDYSTKEIKSGFGLWKVKEIINNTKNVNIQTNKTDKLFVQKLTIGF